MLVVALLSAACTTVQMFPATQQQRPSLESGALERAGVAFITPSTVTGQEEEKQVVALIFAQVLRNERPRINVVTLAEAFSAVNRAGLSDDYKRMYDEYRGTPAFSRARCSGESASSLVSGM